MKDFFSLDNPFNRFMTLVFDIALLSILFAVCSLPVVTFGASAAALGVKVGTKSLEYNKLKKTRKI